MAVCETLARRIAAAGGAALLIDYGQDGPYNNSLTAIRGHTGGWWWENVAEDKKMLLKTRKCC
jgi:SAM-dependent MidA family methyltransferase